MSIKTKLLLEKSLFRRMSSSLTNDDHCPAPAKIFKLNNYFWITDDNMLTFKKYLVAQN